MSWLHERRLREVHVLQGQTKVWGTGREEAEMCPEDMLPLCKSKELVLVSDLTEGKLRVDLTTDLLPIISITLLYSTGSGRLECRLTSILVAVPVVAVLSLYDR